MARISLTNMSVEELLDLRKQVDATLSKRRTELEKQLRELGTTAKVGRRAGSKLKGRKVAAKYRGPSGETWAGRGAKPRWLVAAIKEGKKLEDFLIEKSVAVVRKKRRAKK
jgi:DNA-binding protein H-NS